MRNTARYIQQFADEVQNHIDRVGPGVEFGLEAPKHPDDAKIGKILEDAKLAAEMTAMIAKEVEFLLQGEINKTTFVDRYTQIEAECNIKLAKLSK